MDKINFCKWDVYAKDNMEAQSICEHLKECCIKNGGWTPVMAQIKCLQKSHFNKKRLEEINIMENIRKELIRQKRANEEILYFLKKKELSHSEYLDKVEIEGIIKGLNIALGVLEKCQ